MYISEITSCKKRNVTQEANSLNCDCILRFWLKQVTECTRCLATLFPVFLSSTQKSKHYNPLKPWRNRYHCCIFKRPPFELNLERKTMNKDGERKSHSPLFIFISLWAIELRPIDSKMAIVCFDVQNVFGSSDRQTSIISAGSSSIERNIQSSENGK